MFNFSEYFSYQEKTNDKLSKEKRHRRRGQRKSMQKRLKQSSLFFKNIIDDLWIDIFYFCNVKDFISINKCCKHFNNLTNYKLYHRINLYWKYQSKITYYKNIDNNDTCINNDWREFYLQFKKLSKHSQKTSMDTSLVDLMTEAARFDLVNIGAFAFEKLGSSSYNKATACDDTVELVVQNFLIKLTDLQRFSLALQSCMAQDAIETFKHILSMLKLKLDANEGQDYDIMLEKIIDASCIFLLPSDLFSEFMAKLKESQLAKHGDSNVEEVNRCNFVRNIVLNTFMDMDMVQACYIPMLAVCCVRNAVKIGEYLLSNYGINKMYVKTWRVHSSLPKAFSFWSEHFLGASMIGIVCQYQHIEMIDLLVRNGADPNIMGDINLPNHWQSMNFVSRAVETCDLAMVKLALKPQFKTTKDMINCIDTRTDATPLMRAVSNNCVEIAFVLIKAGADINIRNAQVCYITSI